MEGEPGNRMFIIGSGSVEVVKNMAQTHETVLAVLRPKDLVGEMSISALLAPRRSERLKTPPSLR